MEDLKNEGYVLKGTKLLDYPHAVLAAQHLGRFHACSFALRDKRPTELEKFRKIKEPFFFESGCYKENIDLILEAAILVNYKILHCRFTFLKKSRNNLKIVRIYAKRWHHGYRFFSK